MATIIKGERVQCKKCPLRFNCTVPKDARWRDFVEDTARVEDCPIVILIKKEE